jgi:hypothetical protein
MVGWQPKDRECVFPFQLVLEYEARSSQDQSRRLYRAKQMEELVCSYKGGGIEKS